MSLEVVCAIILFDDQVLATRRGPAQSNPLKWEFPGGKLELGESPEAALQRELLEELDFRIRILERLDPVDDASGEQEIRLIPFVCVPDQAYGPCPHEHCELRWIQPEAAKQLDWASADRPLVSLLHDLLRRAGDLPR